jgi:hypothetical protein
MPSSGVGAGSVGRPATLSMTARCTVGQDTRRLRATSVTHRLSPTASAIAWRSRALVRTLGATAGTRSVNVPHRTVERAAAPASLVPQHLHRVRPTVPVPLPEGTTTVNPLM